MVCPVFLEEPVLQVDPEELESRDPRVFQDSLDRRGSPDWLVLPACLDLRDCRERLVSKGTLDLRVTRDLPVSRDLRGLASRGRSGSLEELARTELWAELATLDRKDLQAVLERLAPLDSRVR